MMKYLEATRQPLSFFIALLEKEPISKDLVVWWGEQFLESNRVDMFAHLANHPLYHQSLQNQWTGVLLKCIKQGWPTQLREVLKLKPSSNYQVIKTLSEEPIWIKDAYFSFGRHKEGGMDALRALLEQPFMHKAHVEDNIIQKLLLSPLSDNIDAPLIKMFVQVYGLDKVWKHAATQPVLLATCLSVLPTQEALEFLSIQPEQHRDKWLTMAKKRNIEPTKSLLENIELRQQVSTPVGGTTSKKM